MNEAIIKLIDDYQRDSFTHGVYFEDPDMSPEAEAECGSNEGKSRAALIVAIDDLMKPAKMLRSLQDAALAGTLKLAEDGHNAHLLMCILINQTPWDAREFPEFSGAQAAANNIEEPLNALLSAMEDNHDPLEDREQEQYDRARDRQIDQEAAP